MTQRVPKKAALAKLAKTKGVALAAKAAAVVPASKRKTATKKRGK
ncbi:hypothetical protein [Streptomyces rectiverticillatus]|nr:hypothetical protein [Streptomyces rectiverticillatus]